MNDKELDALIGTTLEVFTDEECTNINEIVVKSWKKVGESFVLLSEEGEIYSEEDVNWRYCITPEALLWLTLQNAEIIDEDEPFNYDKYHKAFISFMDELVKQGIVINNENNEN